MINNRWPGALFLLSCAVPVAAEQPSTERNPFAPETAAHKSRIDRSPVKGVVGDGERWHFWTTDANGRWHQRDPADAVTPCWTTILDKDGKP